MLNSLESNEDLNLPNVDNQRIMVKLIDEYESVNSYIQKQNQHYKEKIHEMKTLIKNIIEENDRLREDLKKHLETHIHILETEQIVGEGDQVTNLRQQLLSAAEEKKNVLELWHVALKEIERLEEQIQEQSATSQVHHLLQQIIQIKNHYNKIIVTMDSAYDNLKEDCRKTRTEVHTANIQIQELRLALDGCKQHIMMLQSEKAELINNKQSLKEEIQQLQETLATSQLRISETVQKIIELQDKSNNMEEQLQEMSKKNLILENREFEALQQVKDSIQTAENALLEKDHALIKSQQAQQESARLQHALTHLINEAGARTKKEVENMKKLCNVHVQQLMNEIRALELENSEKREEIERAIKEKRAAEAELEKVGKKLHDRESVQQYSDIHNRLVKAENRTQEAENHKEILESCLKQMEENHEKERQHWKSELQIAFDRIKHLEAERQLIASSNVKLAKHVEGLQEKLHTLRKQAETDQRKISKELLQMKHEKDIQQQELTSRLESFEEVHHCVTKELRQMLAEQQRLSSRWKTEMKNLSQSYQSKLNDLQKELLVYKRQNSDLSTTIKDLNSNLLQYETQIAKYANRIQKLQMLAEEKEKQLTNNFKKVFKLPNNSNFEDL